MKLIIENIFFIIDQRLIKSSRIIFLLILINILLHSIVSSKIKLGKITQLNYRDQFEQVFSIKIKKKFGHFYILI